MGGEISDPARYSNALPQLFSEMIILHTIYMYEDITHMADRTGQKFPALERINKLLNSVHVQNEVLNEIISLINVANSEGRAVSVDTIEKLLDEF
jgi:hypothetical protein